MSDAVDFVVVGHLVKDVAPEAPGGWRIGGTAAYASALALRLGLRVGVLTCATRELLAHPALDGVDVRGRVVDEPTSFANHYDGSDRVQRLCSRAPDITADDVPDAWRGASTVLLGPVAGEVGAELAAALRVDASGARGRVGACLQGWLRAVDDSGRVSPRSADVLSTALLESIDVAFVSPEDLLAEERAATLARISRHVDPLLYTLAERGADVFCRAEHGAGVDDGSETRLATPRRIAAFAADSIDPTGAGDIFAAGYLVARADGADVLEAARFAACAASFIVEAEGLSGLPSRADIAARLGA